MYNSTFADDNSFNPRYQCFCCHIKTAALTLSWIFLILFVFILPAIFSTLFKFSFEFFMAFVALDAFIYATFVYAIDQEKRHWLLPYLGFTGICIVLQFSTVIFAGMELLKIPLDERLKIEWFIKDVREYSFLLQLFALILNIWFFKIIKRFYEYLFVEEKRTQIFEIANTFRNIYTINDKTYA